MRDLAGAKRAISGHQVNLAKFDVPRYEFEVLMREVGPVANDEMLIITVQRYTSCRLPGCLAHGD